MLLRQTQHFPLYPSCFQTVGYRHNCVLKRFISQAPWFHNHFYCKETKSCIMHYILWRCARTCVSSCVRHNNKKENIVTFQREFFAIIFNRIISPYVNVSFIFYILRGLRNKYEITTEADVLQIKELSEHAYQ